MDSINDGERRGWIKLFRKFQDSRYFKDSYMVHLINYLLIKANYEDKSTIFSGSLVHLRRGQLIFGLNAANRDTGISIKRIRRRMWILESEGFLERDRPFFQNKTGTKPEQKRAGKYSILTICNYELYQGSRDDGGQSEGQAEGNT